MLHIITCSPFVSDAFASCLRLLQPGQAILLIEDGVTAVVKHSAIAEQLTKTLKQNPVYVLIADLETRGIKNSVLEGVQLIDYDGFVDLVAQHNPIQNWS